MLVYDGYRLCTHCVRRSGVSLDDALRKLPGVYNWQTNIRHLLCDDGVMTVCGVNSDNANWAMTAADKEREYEQMMAEIRDAEREREALLAGVE